MHKFTPEVRRPFYFLIAAILGVLPVLGIITAEQLDSWMEVLKELSPWVGSAALTIAGAKTKHGSDDPATQDDIIQAYKDAVPVYPVEGMEPVALEPAPTDRVWGPAPSGFSEMMKKASQQAALASAEAALIEAHKVDLTPGDFPEFTPAEKDTVLSDEEEAKQALAAATRRE